jgi:hypothetical protein
LAAADSIALAFSLLSSYGGEEIVSEGRTKRDNRDTCKAGQFKRTEAQSQEEVEVEEDEWEREGAGKGEGGAEGKRKERVGKRRKERTREIEG